VKLTDFDRAIEYFRVGLNRFYAVLLTILYICESLFWNA